MKQLIKILPLIFLVFFSSNLFSQIKIHKHLTTEDGLVGNRVICMYEDSKGYLWFGTTSGVSRWDGDNFKNYTTLNGLGGSQVFDIKEDKNGVIYFATYGKGITYLKNDSLFILNNKNGLPTNWITKILVRKNGDIVLAAEYGLITAIRNNKIIDLKKEINYSNNSIWSVYEKEDSTLFFGGYKLFKYKDGDYSEYTHDDSFNKSRTIQTIYSIEEDDNDNLFIGTLNGIYKLVENKLQRIKVNGKINSFPVNAIKKSLDGSIYFGGNEGILVKKGNNFNTIKEANGLSQNNIWSIYEDSNGTLYFGTKDQGVNIYHPKKIETYLPEKLFKKNITAINSDSKNNMYFGTSEGLYLNKRNAKQINEIIVKTTINCINIDENDQLFIGSYSGLIVKNNEIIKIYQPRPERETLNQLHSVSILNSEEVIGGFQDGLYILNEKKLKKLSSLKGHDQFIQDLILTNDSSIVLGTHGNGISIYKSGKERSFNISNGLTDNIVNCLHETKEKLILVGTDQGGLNIIQNYIVLKNITIDDGLSSNTILDINEDNFGNIYLSTSKGVNIVTNLLDSLFVRTILKADGLVTNNCNRNATYIDDKGIIWIGTSNGVTKYNPIADKEITSPPKIYLSDLEIFNKKYPIKDLVNSNELNYNQNYLKFFFTGINLSAPNKILYKYKLEGVDEDWVESKENNVQYTSLDDGNYTFEVKARNEWGYWSQPTSLAFTINPAWWETWWFQLSIISFLGFLLWLAFQYRLNYLLKLERLRTKIATDLHDEVGSILTQISINVDSLSYTKDELKRKEKSILIKNKSKEVIGMMSDVIWSIDSRNDNMESLVDRIHTFAQKFLEQKDIALHFNSDIDDLHKSLQIDFRQNAMMLLKEAINNAVKYSKCNRIDINIISKNNLFALTVKDNGKGFDIENVKRGNGLNNMKMRAELIGADIEIKNENGCLIKLTKSKL